MSEQQQSSINPAQVAAALGTAGLVVGMDPLRDFLVKGRSRYNAANPSPKSAADAEEALSQATVQRMNEIKPGYTRDNFRVVEPQVAIANGINPRSAQASNIKLDRSKVKVVDPAFKNVENIISINPYTDRVTLAHELGHSVMQRSAVGKFNNILAGKLRRGDSLMEAAKFAAPVLGAALTPGSEDLATALALSYAMHAPLLIDEAGATLEGFGLMKRAGMPADAAQKRRMAGAFLSYLVKPTLLGLAGSQVGNLIDENEA